MIKKTMKAKAIRMIGRTRQLYGYCFVHQNAMGNYYSEDGRIVNTLDYELTNVVKFSPEYLSEVKFDDSWKRISINDICDQWMRELNENIPD